MGSPLGDLAPKPKWWEALGGAPNPPGYVRWGEGAIIPLVGWFAPSPWPISPPNTCRGPPKPLSVMLVITKYPLNNSRLQYPLSYILIFTSRPFWSSSSCRGSHRGL